MLNAALKEINELKAENREMLLAVMELEIDLKQIKLSIYNSLKDEFINSNQSCELILASRIHNLELDND